MKKEKWIILIMQESSEDQFTQITSVDEIAVVDTYYDTLIVFNSLEEASNHQEEHGISGRCVELPLF